MKLWLVKAWIQFSVQCSDGWVRARNVVPEHRKPPDARGDGRAPQHRITLLHKTKYL
jgi:hypothetical protein